MLDSDLKRSVCNIVTENRGSGFFIEFLIPPKQKQMKGLMTNNHVIDENFIKNNESLIICFENNDQNKIDEIKIKSDKLIFTSKLIDITFIQLSDDEIKRIKPFFLEPDYNEYKCYENEIQIIQYPENLSHEQQLAKAYGKIIEIDGYNCYHLVSTYHGSSGSPLLNNKNLKVIGVHKGSYNNCSEIFKKLVEKHKNYLSEKDNFINVATKLDIVEYAINLFYNNKNLDIMYEARDLSRELMENEINILKSHDLIPKKLYYIERGKVHFLNNNPLYLFEGSSSFTIQTPEKEVKTILFCRTNHGWYFTINPPKKDMYFLDEITWYKWSIIYQKNFKVPHIKICKELFPNMHIILILWLKLTEFKYLI